MKWALCPSVVHQILQFKDIFKVNLGYYKEGKVSKSTCALTVPLISHPKSEAVTGRLHPLSAQKKHAFEEMIHEIQTCSQIWNLFILIILTTMTSQQKVLQSDIFVSVQLFFFFHLFWCLCRLVLESNDQESIQSCWFRSFLKNLFDTFEMSPAPPAISQIPPLRLWSLTWKAYIMPLCCFHQKTTRSFH